MTNRLLEMTTEIVSAHASNTSITKDELLDTIKAVYSTLEILEKGQVDVAATKASVEAKPRRGRPKKETPAEGIPAGSEELFTEAPSAPKGRRGRPKKEVPAKTALPEGPACSIEEAFQPDYVKCMVCGKKMTFLKKHILAEHELKPGQYRKKYGIPREQDLVAFNYAAKRRQAALDRGLGDKLAAARAKGKKKSEVAK